MVTLCSNRPESFGPHSNIHPALPTTCFLDVIVVPLPTWIYLLITPLLATVYFRGRRVRAFKTDNLGGKTRVSKVLTVVYYVLLVAMIAMMSLEIARLSVAHLGIGLLPFVYAGVLAAGIIHFGMVTILARGISAVYWIALAAAMGVKLGAMIKEEGAHNRVGIAAKYALGDEVTDNGVMIGVEVVLALLELVA